MKITFQNNHCTVFESVIYRTTTTMVYNEKAILLVDPNLLPQEIEQIKIAVDRLVSTRKLYLLFTHSDYDHIVAYGVFPGAEVIASKVFVADVNQAEALEALHQFDEELYLKRNYPFTYPEVNIVIDKDETELELEGLKLKFWLAPGHTACGLFTLVENFGILIVGDYLSNIEFPFVYDSVGAYENTLTKIDPILAKHPIKIMIPGHGGIAYSKTEIQERKTESVDYLLFLKKAGKGQNLFAKDWIAKRYDFGRSLKKSHERNLRLAQKEYAVVS